MADVKYDQIKFKSNLGKIRKENNKRRSKEQKNSLHNIDMLYKGRTRAIKFYDYSLMASEAKKKKKYVKGLKILTHKQLLKRLPITLGQVKAGDNSESLLNEIRQTVYSLHQSKEITKKVYDNIIKSIQL